MFLMLGKNLKWKQWKIIPSHYLGAPSLSRDAKLQMAIIKLELIPDPEMYKFFEKSTGEGISYITNRYSIQQSQQ